MSVSAIRTRPCRSAAPHLLIALLLVLSMARSSEGTPPAAPSVPELTSGKGVMATHEGAQPQTHRSVANPAFGVGERLVFSIEYLGIGAGRATLEIPEILEIGSAKVYRLVSESRTNSFFDALYRVRNRHESYIDVERLCSWKYVENQHERSTLRYRISEYDQIGHMATITRYPVQRNGRPLNEAPPKVETVPVQPFVQDVLSALYYLRTQDLRVGGVYRVPTISGAKSYELIVRIPRKRTVKTPLGKFETLELIPELKYDGLFIDRGKSYVYVTDDHRKMPVLLRSKVAIGSFKAILTERHLADLVTESDATPQPGT